MSTTCVIIIVPPPNDPDPKIKEDAGDGIDFKNPFTMSKTDDGTRPAPGIADASESGGKLVASSWMLNGGAYRDRTDDLKLAKLALSQLS